MSPTAFRRDRLDRIVGDHFSPSTSSITVVYKAGAQVKGNQGPATSFTVSPGHYFPAAGGVKFCVLRYSGGAWSMLASSLRSVSSSTATTVVFAAQTALTVLDGDYLVHVGTDGGTTTPLFTGSDAVIYPTRDLTGTPVSQSRLATNTQGETQYFTSEEVVWEVIVSGTTVQELRVDALGPPDRVPRVATLPTDNSNGDLVFLRANGVVDTLYAWIRGASGTSAWTQVFPNGLRFNAKDFGATGNGSTDDRAAIQLAIDAATAIQSQTGSDAKVGAKVFLPVGRYKVNGSIVLPRATQSTHPRAVWLEGETKHSTVLVGGTGFSSGDGVIEWAATAFRAWDNRIANLTIIAPDTIGTHAVLFEPTLTATWAQINAERFNLVMENVEMEGSNEFHSALCRIKGMATHCRFLNVWCDPATGVRAFETMGFEFDSVPLFDPNDNIGDDAGCGWGTFQNIWISPQRGGYCGFLKGRIAHSSVNVVEVGVGGYSAPILDIDNSIGTIIKNLFTEGRGEQPAQVRLTDSRYISFYNIHLGHPTNAGGGVGNGVDFVSSTDCVIDGRVGDDFGMVAFKDSSVKMVTLDANSKRNRLRMAARVASAQTIADEFTDSGTDNWITLIDHTNNREYHRGGSVMGSLRLQGDQQEYFWLQQISEEILINNTGTPTFDSTNSLLPADSFILGVVARCSNTVGGAPATTYKIGDNAGTPVLDRFHSGPINPSDGITARGWNHLQGVVSASANGPVQITAGKIRLTFSGNPTDTVGKIRVSVFYYALRSPQSDV